MLSATRHLPTFSHSVLLLSSVSSFANKATFIHSTWDFLTLLVEAIHSLKISVVLYLYQLTSRNMPKEYRSDSVTRRKLVTFQHTGATYEANKKCLTRGPTPISQPLSLALRLRSSTNGLNWLSGFREILCKVLGKVCQARLAVGERLSYRRTVHTAPSHCCSRHLIVGTLTYCRLEFSYDIE